METIAFRTLAQKILFVTEICGQLSDGAWENSRPADHWRLPCRATVVVNPSQQGLSFRPDRRYSFANRMLLEVCGERMINYVKLFTAYPEMFAKVDHHDVSCESDFVKFAAEIEEKLTHKDKYWRERSEKILKAFGVETVDQLRVKLLSVVNVPYTEKDMRKDLREMSKVFNETYDGTIGKFVFSLDAA